MEHLGLLDAFSLVATHHGVSPASIMATITVLNYIHDRIKNIAHRRKNRSSRHGQARTLRTRATFRQVQVLFRPHRSLKHNSRRGSQ